MEEIQPLEQDNIQIEAADAHPAADSITTTKRQRRPSVRLGEIGDTLSVEPYRRPKQWKPSGGKEPAGKSSKTRQLAKLSGGGVSYQHDHQQETLDLPEEENRDLNSDNLAIGSWGTNDFKSKRAVKKPRTNWLPKIDDDCAVRNAVENNKSGRGDDDETLGLGGSQLRRSNNSSSRVRAEEETDHHRHEVDSDSGDGVKNWLEGLGLGRYWPLFEIHEVDEEVLTLLTLEDLKDMGINAVGSRRKMFGAIQKLRKGFS